MSLRGKLHNRLARESTPHDLNLELALQRVPREAAMQILRTKKKKKKERGDNWSPVGLEKKKNLANML